ncbi:dTDP-4-dehydrorhamnose reductase, partial [Streptomyces sp. DT225]
MTVLLIGGSGFLGAEPVRRPASMDGSPAAMYRSRPGDPGRAARHRPDLRAPLRPAELLDAVAPAAVINAMGGDPDALSRHRPAELIARRDGLGP